MAPIHSSYRRSLSALDACSGTCTLGLVIGCAAPIFIALSTFSILLIRRRVMAGRSTARAPARGGYLERWLFIWYALFASVLDLCLPRIGRKSKCPLHTFLPPKLSPCTSQPKIKKLSKAKRLATSVLMKKNGHRLPCSYCRP